MSDAQAAVFEYDTARAWYACNAEELNAPLAAEVWLFDAEMLCPAPAAVAVRSYHPDWPAPLGLSYAAIGDPGTPLQGEDGQAVRWVPLSTAWASAFPDDRQRIVRYVSWARARCKEGR